MNAPPSGDVDLVPVDGRTPSPSAPGRTSPAAPEAPRAPDGRGGALPASGGRPAAARRHGHPVGAGRLRAVRDSLRRPHGAPGSRRFGLLLVRTLPRTRTRRTCAPGDGRQRAAAAQRWCEKVTVTLANTGDRAATAGTITFGTHVIGLPGIDWATVRSTRAAPVPVPGDGSAKATWKVCVEAWRVPPGMHVETRDVSVADS
ncbi:hypothetical protein ACFYWP_09395 [Actinacidiphila glaucinigra]|uniref:hypothetical protein n=1 Tax=Actinacidiphila glaucinigra TaxID=235986 RepID=UPI0036A7D7CF